MILVFKISTNDINYFRKNILKWHSTFIVDYPWRNTNNQWHALVAEIMLQRTRAEQVKPIYQSFVKKFPSAESFINYININNSNIFENLGLKWRQGNLINAAKFIKNYGIPKSKEKLLEIDGVGNYIASAFLSLHLNKREKIIDSNIIRLYGRFFGFKYNGETRRKIFLLELAEKITPCNNIKEFNYSLLDFSRNICGIKPKCNECNINKKCYTRNKK